MKHTKALTLSDNCKFVRSSKIIVQLKIEHDLFQPAFDQSLQTNS